MNFLISSLHIQKMFDVRADAERAADAERSVRMRMRSVRMRSVSAERSCVQKSK